MECSSRIVIPFIGWVVTLVCLLISIKINKRLLVQLGKGHVRSHMVGEE
jgi:hypothetical protein